MPLEVPNLDDRRFQDLVDESKRRLQLLCPEWTDHNVHDPGVTLIELFAWMTEQVIYRLNRVPDNLYVRFLDLLGVRLLPPTAARAPVTFWLTAAQPSTVPIPMGTEIATLRTETSDAIVFQTVRDLELVTCALQAAGSARGDERERTRWHDEESMRGDGVSSFGTPPRPGDALLVGLTEAVPSCAVTLRLGCAIGGLGIHPNRPPLAWEAFDGTTWAACEVDHDDTLGLNQDGDVVLHVPPSHAPAVLEQRRAGWVRARVTPSTPDQPPYTRSPQITRIAAFTVGGTVDAVNADIVEGEVVGVAEGVPGQRFQLQRHPVVPGDALVLDVARANGGADDGADGWEEWTEVDDFSRSGPDDPSFVFDAVSGGIALGPAVREADGSLRQFGRVPEKGATIRLRSYRAGGGSHGNVARGTLTVLKSSIPYVARVENRRAAQDGVEGEDMDSAKVRGPILLRHLGRAVTTEDYEHLALEAAPEVARVRCLAASEGSEAGVMRLLVVPAGAASAEQTTDQQLSPRPETVERIGRRLDECRLIGTQVVVEAPQYRWVTIVARLRAGRRAVPERVRERALEALYRYFDPVLGGPDGGGWPFGRPVQVGEVYSVLQRLRGVELVDDVRLFTADPKTNTRGDAMQRLELEPNELVFSFHHQVRVDQ